MMKPHLKNLAAGTLAIAAFAVTSFAQPIASDNAGNYGGGWTDGSNGGFGFAPWVINTNAGTGFAGNFIGDPNAAGVTEMGTSAFGLFANPGGSGAFATATRSFSEPLKVGETFSMQWGINWDGDNGVNGNKGFNLFVGATNVVNLNNGGSSDITFNSIDTGMGFGTAAMNWSFTYVDATTLFVTANDRDGTGFFSNNVTVSGGVTSFELYANELGGGVQRQPYYNNLSIVPEPSTYALLGLGAASVLWRIRRRKTS